MRRALAWALVLSLSTPGSAVQADAAELDWDAVGAEAVALLVDLVRVDTTNPPGNELPAAEHLHRLFQREGIESRVIESAPRRGNVWARLPGGEPGRSVVLLNHLDVVPADPRQWSVPPFAGIVKDGAVWGRGTLDMKGQGAAQAMALVALKRRGVALKRDVVFLGTADEEMGGREGLAVLLRERPDLLGDVAVVVTEGGSIHAPPSRPALYSVSVADKLPFGFTIRARGPAGHGSLPRPGSAVNRLVAGLARLIAWQPPIRVVDDVQRYYALLAPLQPSPWRERLHDLRAALADPVVAEEFTRTPVNNARVRNTLAVTMLEGSSKVNVIPGEALARVDARLLPDEDPQRFIADVRRVLDDPGLAIEVRTPLAPASSPSTHPFFSALEDIAARSDPGAVVAPQLLTAFTDCYHFRRAGVPCYGFVPWRAAPWGTTHGNDEHVTVDDVKRATRVLAELVERLATR